MSKIIAALALVTLGILISLILMKEEAVKTEPVILETAETQQAIEVSPAKEEDEASESQEELKEEIEKGVRFESVYPEEVNFWVNTILVPQVSLYNGSSFILLRKESIKTFAGSFGPYKDDPSEFIEVLLCSELSKVNVAPACEKISATFQNDFMSFAKGYTPDTFIGGIAAKDYTAYFDVFVGNTSIAVSNKAVIRTG